MCSHDYIPPPELEAFLKSGPPPVYIGFGSMAGRNPERLASIVIEALKIASVRGIMRMISNLTLRRKAEDLGANIRHEDGIANAVAVIEEIMSNI